MTSRLKERYARQWSRGNARESVVLTMVSMYAPGFEVRLTGLGAGSSELVEGRYSTPEDAFDITVYYRGRPVAYIDVTGAESVAEVRQHPCKGYCVGSWKLEKALEFKVTRMAWIAFVVDEDLRTLWMPLAWLDQHVEAPYVRKCRLYGDEREVLCTDSRYWKRFGAFLKWLTLYGPIVSQGW